MKNLSPDLPEMRAGELILMFLSNTNQYESAEEATEELQQMIADTIREVIMEERAKVGKTYHLRSGEVLKVVCVQCNTKETSDDNSDEEVCLQCGGTGMMRVPFIGSASVGVRKVRGAKENEPYLILDEHPELVKFSKILIPLLNEQRDATLEYCAALFDDLAERIEIKECFASLDDDEYSRECFIDALQTYVNHIRNSKATATSTSRSKKEDFGITGFGSETPAP